MYAINNKLKIIRMFLVVLITLMVNTAFAQKTITKSSEDDENVFISNNNKTWKYSTQKGLNSFDIEYKGKIEVTDDDKDIKSISPGGYLEVSKTTFGSKREILIESTSGNNLRREYYEGRNKTSWEPDGRKWLAEILPEIVRSTGIAAESRVNRYFKQGGVEGVLNEISRLKGDYVVAIYAKLLLKKEGLSKSDLEKALEGISYALDSDYYLAEVLKDNSEQFLKNDETAEVYFEAVQHISSDYYATLVLKGALQHYKPNAESLEKIMEASKSIGSDYYQAALLSEVLELDNLNGALLADIIETTKNVGSDYYQSQVLSKAMEKKDLSSESFNSLLEAVSDVSSDYYMATVFTKLVENRMDDSEIIKMIDLINNKMSSDYYASAVLTKIMEKQDLSPRAMEKVAEGIGNLGSSHYATSVIKAISDNDNLNKSSLLSLIRAIESISSDYYASSALEAIAPQVKKSDNEVKDAYRSAAKSIHSDTYYGRAMRAIDR